MKLPSIIALLTLTSSSLAATARTLSVSYDTGYDDASRSLNVVSCSDGANGLETRTYSPPYPRPPVL